MTEVRTQYYKGFKMREVRDGHGEVSLAIVELPNTVADVVDFEDGKNLIDHIRNEPSEQEMLTA